MAVGLDRMIRDIHENGFPEIFEKLIEKNESSSRGNRPRRTLFAKQRWLGRSAFVARGARPEKVVLTMQEGLLVTLTLSTRSSLSCVGPDRGG
jgi:hypothetical protein